MQGNLFYEEVRLPRNANATGIYRDHWLNPVYLHALQTSYLELYIVSAIQALSHIFVPEMPPYIAGVTHWESLHIFLCQYKSLWQFCYRIMFFVCCPILSVSVAYFFWPHWVRSVLNYGRHCVIIAFFEKYKLITEIFCEAWKRTLIMHIHCNKYPY